MILNKFADLIDNFANFGDKTALTIKPFIHNQRLSYLELRQKSYQVAQFLIAQQLKKSDRVMVVAANGPAWMELFLGCQLMGVVLVPVDVRSSLATVLKFVDQTKPKIIFRGQAVLDKLDKKQRTMVLDNLDELINPYSTLPVDFGLSGDEAAVIVFTSGTTAEPKGVLLSQRNILANTSGVDRAIAINPAWRILSVLPLSHMYELTGECCMLSRGTSIYYLSTVTPLAIAKALNEYRITTILAVPQLLILLRQRILQTAALEGQAQILKFALQLAPYLPFQTRRLLFRKIHAQLGHKLSLVITGGAPIPPEVADFWERLGMKAVQGYGLTETAPILTVNRLGERRLNSQGKVLYNVKLRVGKDGEIQAKGPSVFSGYWQNSAQTKQAFTKDGWFKTGDIGRLDNGWLSIQGRAKFAIVLSSGLNVFPEDIEAVADQYPALKEVCIVGVTTNSGEIVHAVVVSDKKDKQIDKTIKTINDRLEDFQHISTWSRWPTTTFPRTLLLKIDRKQVQSWANQVTTDLLSGTASGDQPTDPLINLMRDSLDNQQLNVNDSQRLSDLGFDSLRRLALLSAIEERLGINIAEAKINQTTTVKDLKKIVTQSSNIAQATRRPNWQYHTLIRWLGAALRETVIRVLLRLFVTIEIEGREHLQNLQQPVIFIFNHVDGFDGPVLYQALPWLIRNHLAIAAADDVLRRHKLLNLATRLSYAGYNLNRQDNILDSLSYTSDLLDRGWNIAIAPEGHVSQNGRLQHFKSGIGLLAIETGVLIVPVKTSGLAGTMPLNKHWPQHFSHVKVKIGQPIGLDRHVSYKKATKQLYRMMKKL